MAHKYRTSPVPTPDLPKGIPYIIGNEAAERFSFYGMKGILVIFMTQYLHWMTDSQEAAMSKTLAVERYHSFTGWVYLTPIIGALISDAVLGKYRTILSLSMVYCLGHLCLAFMGFDYGGITPGWWLFSGLALIALGSGGIKPCVSAHVGDQFGKTNSQWLSKVFGWFYVSINLGAALSNIATPWLLEWYGPHWAFGVPGVLMAIATFVFWLGRNEFVHVPPGGLGFLRQTFSKEGLVCIFKLLSIFVFFVIFWALFDQTGSTWVLQAQDMNRKWLGVEWLSAQIQFINPVMILILVPLFTMVVYPAIDKYLFALTPLRKIGIGLFLMVVGFAIPSMAQELIESGKTPSIVWQLMAYIVLTASEVMVSITGLEFAYTQAPPKMKSIVMALFLGTVAFGNFVTSGVNKFIQIPDQTAVFQEIKEKIADETSFKSNSEIENILKKHKDVYGKPIRFEQDGDSIKFMLLGQDGEPTTGDDIEFTFNWEDVKRNGETRRELKSKTVTKLDELLESAANIIEEHFAANDESLPQEETALKLLKDLKDPWGESLRYRLINRNNFRVVCMGSDKTYLTKADVILSGTVTRSETDSEKNNLEKYPYTWLEQRRIKIGGDEQIEQIKKERGQSKETGIETSISIGGHTRIEGADYFWFWTKLMLGVAIGFVVVSLFYQPREYLQDEDESETLSHENPYGENDEQKPSDNDDQK